MVKIRCRGHSCGPMNAEGMNLVRCPDRVQTPIRELRALFPVGATGLLTEANGCGRENVGLVRQHRVVPALRSDVIR